MENGLKHEAHVVSYHRKGIEDYFHRETKLSFRDKVGNFWHDLKNDGSGLIIAGSLLVSSLSGTYLYSTKDIRDGINEAYDVAEKIVQTYVDIQKNPNLNGIFTSVKPEKVLAEASELVKKGAKIKYGTDGLKLVDRIEEVKKELEGTSKEKQLEKMQEISKEIRSITSGNYAYNLAASFLIIVPGLLGFEVLGYKTLESLRGTNDMTGKKFIMESTKVNFEQITNYRYRQDELPLVLSNIHYQIESGSNLDDVLERLRLFNSGISKEKLEEISQNFQKYRSNDDLIRFLHKR